MLSIGTMLQDRYRIDNILGKGGMGSVYLAFHVHLGRQVAIKELVVATNDPVLDAAALRQFKHEAQILQSLSHPRLPAVYDYVEIDGQPYLIMEYVKGRSLATVLEAEEEPLPIEQVRDWSVSLCEVLDYLHSHTPPVIFRDLKPSNVMLDVNGQIRLIDFGISKVIESGGKTHTFAKGAGSPGFSAPEQYSLTTDARSDIYSFGATLFALLTFKAPPSSVELAAGLTTLPPIQRYRPEVSQALNDLVMQCMQTRASERPKTAKAVREMLLVGFAAPAGTAPAPVPDEPVLRPGHADASTRLDGAELPAAWNAGVTHRMPDQDLPAFSAEPTIRLEEATLEVDTRLRPPAPKPAVSDRSIFVAALCVIVACVLLLLYRI